MEKTRDTTIDILKGIGIILVIMGHLASTKSYVGNGLFDYIYSFHMPLFFFVAGMLRYMQPQKDFRSFLKNSFSKIMIPYFIFLIISMLYTNTVLSYLRTGQIFAYAIDFKSFLLAFFLGGGYLDKIPCSNFALWYLPLFFVATIVFYLLTSTKKLTKYMPLIVVILIIITIPFQQLFSLRPFLHIDVLPVALVFLALGYLYKKHENLDKHSKYISILSLFVGIVIAFLNKGNISRINHIIYYLGAFCSIYFFYHVAKQSNNKVLSYIGKNSLYIFALHSLVMSTYPFVGIESLFSTKWSGFMLFMIKTIFTLGISTILCFVYNLISKKMKLLNNNDSLSNIVSVIRTSALFIIVLFTIILFLSSALFIVKIPITIFHLPIAFILSVILLLFVNRKEKIVKTIIAISLATIMIFLAIVACTYYYDLSWDGNTYHKEAVGILKNGWNPLYDDYLEFHMSNSNRDMSFIGTDVEYKPGLWVTHYAKGPWIIDANFYSLLNNIESAKVFNLLSIYVLFGIVLSCTYNKTKSIAKASVLALLCSITPITIVQAFSFYNDGALYTILTSILIIFALFIKEKYEDISKLELYTWLVCLLIVGINLKFTCFIYMGIFCFAYYLIYLWNNYRQKTLKNVIKPTIIISITVLVSLLLVGASTYITNTIKKGHPFYPLMGKDSVDIISYNQPVNFENKSVVHKFTKSLFSEASNSQPANNKEAKYKIPFTASENELKELFRYDIRTSGYGVWYSGIFIISVVICAIGLFHSYKKDKFVFQITGMTLFVTTILILVLNESWWARYTPFLYFYPLIALVYLFTLFKSNIIYKIITTVLVATIVINMGYFFVYNTIFNYKASYDTRKSLNTIKKNNQTITIIDEKYDFFGALYNLDDLEIQYNISDNKNKNDKKILRYIRYNIINEEN